MNTSDIKKDFAIYDHEPDLVYLDSAATSLTPEPVLDAMNAYYREYNANIARGVYHLSERATEEYEAVRDTVAAFIGAERADVVFTSGTTMGLNTIALGLKASMPADAEIIVTAMEHHANFVPWQRLVESRKSKVENQKAFKVIKLTGDGKLDMDDLISNVNEKTFLVALPYVSNVLGTINPVRDIVEKVKDINPETLIVVDAAQAVPHMKIDVVALGADFVAFSSHKMCGPTGAGVLWGKTESLEKIEPLFTGGEMIADVSTTETSYKDLPHRLEAGTPNIAGIIGLGAAVNYIEKIGLDDIRTHEKELTTYALEKLREEFGDSIKIYGPENTDERSGVISFTLESLHPHDVAALLDSEMNISVRAGNHCAMPLHREYLNVPATVRASFYVYNNTGDIDTLVGGLKKVQKILTK